MSAVPTATPARGREGGRAPLVVTLGIDGVAQRRFDEERATLFPPGRTAVGAHVTLFHAVPGAREPQVLVDVDEAVRREPFTVQVAGLMLLGRGVAYRLGSPELAVLHEELQRRWWPWLTRQDRQPFRPHVTVQNKVTPVEARDTKRRLDRGFAAHEVEATGLLVWRYLDGPWELLCEAPFTGPVTGPG